MVRVPVMGKRSELALIGKHVKPCEFFFNLKKISYFKSYFLHPIFLPFIIPADYSADKPAEIVIAQSKTAGVRSSGREPLIFERCSVPVDALSSCTADAPYAAVAFTLPHNALLIGVCWRDTLSQTGYSVIHSKITLKAALFNLFRDN